MYGTIYGMDYILQQQHQQNEKNKKKKKKKNNKNNEREENEKERNAYFTVRWVSHSGMKKARGREFEFYEYKFILFILAVFTVKGFLLNNFFPCGWCV